MKRLTATLCLTIAVLLGSVGVSYATTLSCKGERHLSASYTKRVKTTSIDLTVTIRPVSKDTVKLHYSYYYPPSPPVSELPVCKKYDQAIFCSEKFTDVNGVKVRREVKLDRMTGKLRDFMVVKNTNGEEMGDSQLARCRVSNKKF